MILILRLILLLEKGIAEFSANPFIEILTITGVIILVKKLTAGVLQGTNYRENMQVEWDGETYEIEIRALNNREASEVEALMQEGVNIKGRAGRGGNIERIMDFDAKQNLIGRKESDIKAIALGTTDESITESVVANEFPPKLVNEIGGRIKQITGIGNIEEIEGFSEGEDTPSN